jgi:hypothetical protein
LDLEPELRRSAVSRFAGSHLAVRVAAAAVGAAAIMLASGCGAGQIAETAKITPAVPGASGSSVVPHDPNDPNAPDGQILAQNVTIAYQNPIGYLQGSTAPLEIRVINNSPVDVALTGAVSPLGTVTLGGKGATPVATPSVVPSGQPSANPSANPSGSASPSPQPAPAPAPAAIKIPAGQIVELTTTSGQFLQITNLAQAIKPGDNTNLALSFTNLSDPSRPIGDLLLIGVPIGPPAAPASRQAVPNQVTES